MTDTGLSANRKPFDLQLGQSVPLSVLVHRTRRLAVFATGFVAYRNGFSFLLYVAQRERPADSVAAKRGSNINAYNVNLLVTGPDNMRLEVEADDLGGGGAGWRQLRYFVLALPPTGPMTMTLEWPGRRSISVSVPLDSRAVLAAASKARYLWPEAN